MKAVHSGHSGFTALELAVTVAIVAILIIIAVPSYQQLIANQGVKNASFDLFSALTYTRSEAIKRPTDTVVLCAGNSTSNDGAWATGWRLVVGPCSSNPLRTWTPASNLTISDKAGGATSITFGRDGHLSLPTTAPKIQVDPAVTLAGVTPRCIQIDLVGFPRTSSGACP